MAGNNLLIPLRLLTFARRQRVLGNGTGNNMLQRERNHVGDVIMGIGIALVLCAILFLTGFLFFSHTL